MIRGVLGIIVASILTPIFGILIVASSLVRPGNDLIIRLGRMWSNALLAVTGSRPTYVGLDRFDPGAPHIFLSNHASIVDIWVLLRIVPLSTRFVAKDTLFRWPFLGWALRAAGFIPIDRNHRGRAIASLQRAAETIRSGRSVVLFPEGTRSLDGQLGPFKKGAFHLALEAGVPVVPVTIRGSFDRLRPGGIHVIPGPVEVIFDEPIDVAAFRPENVQGLLERVHRQIANRLGESPNPVR